MQTITVIFCEESGLRSSAFPLYVQVDESCFPSLLKVRCRFHAYPSTVIVDRWWTVTNNALVKGDSGVSVITASERPIFKLSPTPSFLDYRRFYNHGPVTLFCWWTIFIIIAIFLRIPASALRDNYWKHLATYKNFDSIFSNLNITFSHWGRFLGFSNNKGFWFLTTLFLHYKYGTIFAVFC